MALSEGSDRFQTWLEPWRMDLDPALTAYAFNITNKDEVLRGKVFSENQNRFVFMTMILRFFIYLFFIKVANPNWKKLDHLFTNQKQSKIRMIISDFTKMIL